ncbi:MAG: O-antigen ligase family protein [Oscillospiraceae bacterium]|nr:O-antigen ligase family protein [Oscillospiraceae bacterium]
MAKKDRNLLILMAVGLSMLLVLRDILDVSISKYLFLVYIVLFMAVAQYKVMVHMVCFILPLVCGLPGTYIMPCALGLLLFKKERVNLKFLLSIIILMLLELVASFWYPNQNLTLIVQYVSFASILLYLIYDDTAIDNLMCVRMFFLGTILLCGVIIVTGLQEAPDNWLELFEKGQFRFGQTHWQQGTGLVLNVNANSLAYYSAAGFACGLLFVDQSIGKRKLFWLAGLLVCIIAGFLTLSRTWIITVFIILILYTASKLRSPKQFLTLLLVLAVLATVAVVYFNQNPELLAGITTRLEDTDVEGGNGRVELFFQYMDIYSKNIRYILLGMGVTQYRAISEINSLHNGTQQILVCCGLVGFVVYMIALVGSVWGACKGKKCAMIYWLPLLAVVFFVQSIQFLNPMMLMLPYAAGVYALKAGGEKDEELSHNSGH